MATKASPQEIRLIDPPDQPAPPVDQDQDLVSLIADSLDDQAAKRGEPDEDEGGGAPSGDPQGPAPTPPPARKRYTFKVDGQEFSEDLTEDELVAGYQSKRAFTQHSQKLAESRKAVEAKERELEQQRAYYTEHLAHLVQTLQDNLGREPDWNTLYEEDPIEASKQFAQWQLKKEKLAAAKRESRRLQEEQAQREGAQAREYIQTEHQRLMEAVPEWRDDAAASKEKVAIRAYATEIGFTPQELAQTYDHRMILVLRDAARYRGLLKRKAELSKGGALEPAVMSAEPRPAQPMSVSSTSKRKDAFRKDPSINNAARLIEDLI